MQEKMKTARRMLMERRFAGERGWEGSLTKLCFLLPIHYAIGEVQFTWSPENTFQFRIRDQLKFCFNTRTRKVLAGSVLHSESIPHCMTDLLFGSLGTCQVTGSRSLLRLNKPSILGEQKLVYIPYQTNFFASATLLVHFHVRVDHLIESNISGMVRASASSTKDNIL